MSTSRSINLVAWDNKAGLSSDLRLLARALAAVGYEVHFSTLRRGKLRKWTRPLRRRLAWLWGRLNRQGRFDANLMLEHIRSEDFPFARCNLFLPNPEWCSPGDLERLPRMNGVLAKTGHAEAIFRALGCPTVRVGFTSMDRLDASVPREHAFFHLAGRSPYKGTDRLLALWRKHPEWPRLTVVQSPRSARPGSPAGNIVHRIDYVDDIELKRLQNANAFHLCCSETEGFGHYIVEGMSVGAVVLTTDAPPMNELVTLDRGVLVGYEGTDHQQLATTYRFSERALEAAVQRCLAMSEADRIETGRRARAWFESNDAGFAERLRVAIEAMLESA
ncbi:MAG TPA: glycosyl transferase family 1 [Rhodanobacteraceae bacterium]